MYFKTFMKQQWMKQKILKKYSLFIVLNCLINKIYFNKLKIFDVIKESLKY